MSGTLTFFQTFFYKAKSLGAVLPSSQVVVKEVISVLAQKKEGGKRILEVGAGSGVITERILTLLEPTDTFDIVELEPEFADTLKKMIEKSGKKSQVTLHMKGIESFESSKKYTYIFSSLPLTNFDEALVQKIYEKFEALLDKTGKMSYYEYYGMGSIRLAYYKMAGMTKEFQRLKRIREIKSQFLSKGRFKEKVIFSNLFPARVCHIEALKLP
jgi:phospholipid N-methyltransferase